MNAVASRRLERNSTCALTFLVLSWAVPAFAGGGNVLPPTARPHGYSLTDLARITGVFNGASPWDGVPPTEGTPFEMLYARANGDKVFHVDPGTTLYVPVAYSIGDGIDVDDKAAVANLYFSPEKYGADYIEIVVDGRVASLIRFGYPVGAFLPLDGGGTLDYSTVAAFLSPLTPGTHKVTIRALFDGALLGGGTFEYSDTYTVIVDRPGRCR